MNVWRVPIDERSGRAKGEATPVTTPSLYVRNISMGKDESQFVFVQARMQVDLFSVAFDPLKMTIVGSPAAITRGPNSVANFSLSPDEKQIVFDTLTDTEENLWVMNADGSGRRRLTRDKAIKDRSKAWSPTSQQIVFYSDRGARNLDNYDVWMINSDGSELHQVTALSKESVQSPGLSQDGSKVLVQPGEGHPGFAGAGGLKLGSLPERLPGFQNLGFAFFAPWHGNFKRWIGRARTPKSAPELFLYDPASGKVEPLGVIGDYPQLLPGERHFVYFRGESCYLYDLDAWRERVLFSVAPHKLFSMEMTRDGRRLYFSQAKREGQVWLARMKR